jgi:hypothetical protein
MKPTKYRARKVTVDGMTFDSQGEHRKWCELRLLEKTGAIRNLERQVRIPLNVNGKKICAVVIDFAWFEGDRRIWADFKSEYTRKLPVWRIKKKLIEALYPVVQLRELTR